LVLFIFLMGLWRRSAAQLEQQMPFSTNDALVNQRLALLGQTIEPSPVVSPAVRRPVDMDWLLREGRVQVQRGDIAGGIATLRRVIEHTPDKAEAWLWLGWALARQQDTEQAESCFLKAQKLDHPQADQALAWLKRRS
jgi:Flp pilus assembly protein TadD